MSQPIDEVYVDIHARGASAAADDVEDAARSMQRYLDGAARDIERAFQQTSRKIARDIELGAESAERSVDDLADSATRDLRRIEREAGNAGRDIARSFSQGGGFASIIEKLSLLGANLRNISALAPPPIFIALAALLPAIIALGGALADLSGLLLLLPAGIGGLIASVAALQLAFSGVGEAVEALASGDLEKINAAMQNLAPSAQAFAREINNLREPLRQLKIAVQEAFFAPLRGELTRLVNAALPTLRTGLAQVAGSFGELGRQLFDLLGSQDILTAIGSVFASTARIITNLAPQLTDLLGTLFGVAERGMPFLERAFAALGRGMESLDKFLEGSLQSGSFEDFLESAFQIMKDLGALTKSVFNLLGALFGDMGDEGSTFIQTLADMTQQLADFLNSAEGQAVLQRLVDTLPLLLNIVAGGVVLLATIAVMTETWYQFLEALGGAVWDAIGAIGEFFGQLGGWVSSAGGAASTFFSDIFTWFAELGPRIWAAITALPGIIMGTLVGLFDWLTYTVGYTIGSVIQFFMDLPGRIQQALLFLVGVVIFTFTDLRDRIIGFGITLVENVFDFFTRMRDGASERTSSMVSTVGQFFRDLGPRIISYIVNLPDRVFAIFRRIRDGAIGIGRSILDGIITGIRNGLSAAVGWAVRAAQGILRGMKDALGIASPSRVFADEVGRWIPIGIADGIRRNMNVAVREVQQTTDPLVSAAQEILAAMNRGTFIEEDLSFRGNSDLVRQLNERLNSLVTYAPGEQFSQDKVRSALEGFVRGAGTTGGGSTSTTAADNGSLFGAGAIQVIFQGAVPTEAEAVRTGQAVGSGIAQSLARHNVRTAVRIA